MKLQQAILDVLDSDDEAVIFAKCPWTAESDSVISTLTESHGIPEEMKKSGFDYFLEKEYVENLLVFRSRRRISIEQFVDLVIFYASNDAYPSWIFDIPEA